MICRQVNIQTDECSNQILKLEFKQQNRCFAVNDKPIALELPVRYQPLGSRTYIYLSDQVIVAIRASDLPAFEKILKSNALCSLRVPDQSTRQLVSEIAVQNKCSFIHCGTFNSTHYCFIQIEQQQISVRNRKNLQIRNCHIRDAQFDDAQKRINLGQDDFYFWQALSYLEAKSIINQANQQNGRIQPQKDNQNVRQQEVQGQNSSSEQQVEYMREQRVAVGGEGQQQMARSPVQAQKIQQEAAQFSQIREFQVGELQQQNQQNQGEMIQQQLVQQHHKRRQHQQLQQHCYQPVQKHQQDLQKQERVEQSQQQEQVQKEILFQQKQKQNQPISQPQQNEQESKQQSKIEVEQHMIPQQVVQVQPIQNQMEEEQPYHQAQHNADQILRIQSIQVVAPGLTPPHSEGSGSQEQSDNKMFPPRKKIKKQQKSNWKSNSKNKKNRTQQRKEEEESSIENEGSNQYSLETPAKRVGDSEEFQESRSSANNILNTVFKLALNTYKQSNYRIELCCLNGCDVIDIRRIESKQYLYYSKFAEDGVEAESQELCELKYVGQDGEGEIKPTRLLFDPVLHSVFYNDLSRPYLHEYSLKTRQQSSHNMRKVILDMAMNTKGIIIGIENNKIFSYEGKVKWRQPIARYKSVRNFCKISNCFKESHFAIASQTGVVRVFDLNNYGKAVNKLKMPPGITSLQISDTGKFILCRYGHKAQMIQCTDKNSESMFETRTKLEDRKNVKKLVKGYEHLSHLQFLHKEEKSDSLIAVDDENPCRLVIRNIQRNQNFTIQNLTHDCQSVEYLNCFQDWIIYSRDGCYFRQKVA